MLHFNITEDSVNVQDVTERAREGFAESTLVVVRANGLRIADKAVTRGNGKIKTIHNMYAYLYVCFCTYVLFLSLIKQNEICPLELLVYCVAVKIKCS